MLVSVDSFGSLLPMANAPQGHRFPRSPHPATVIAFDQGVRIDNDPKSKPGTTVKVIPGFDVEHRRFELLTPTLPARQNAFSGFFYLFETQVKSKPPAILLCLAFVAFLLLFTNPVHKRYTKNDQKELLTRFISGTQNQQNIFPFLTQIIDFDNLQI